MDNLIISLNATAPLFIMMTVGFLFRKAGLVSEDLIFKINKLIFKLFLPCMFFSNIYSADIKSIFNGRLIIFTIAVLTFLFLLTILFVCIIRKDSRRRGALIQSIFRSNYVILGIPMIVSVFGDAGAATAALMATFIVPFFNMYTVIILEIFRSGKVRIQRILLSVIKNPLIIAAVSGILIKLTGIKLPYIISHSVSSFGNVTTPLAVFMLGAFFQFKHLKHDIKDILISAAGRLIIYPLISTGLAYLFGFRGVEFACILIAFGAPVAITSFPMAQQMDSDYTLAGETVIFQSALSCFTLFLWIFLFKQLGVM